MGYQAWHRLYDVAMVDAARSATSFYQFTTEVNAYYARPNIIEIFGIFKPF